MTDYIAPGEQITAAWLSAVLHQAGILEQGEVASLAQVETGAFNSQTMRLVLQYSADASPNAPTRLVVKRNADSEWGREAGADEVKFYRLMAPLPDHPPVIVPCYAAAYDETSGNSYLLLQDLSETHAPPMTRDQQIHFVEGVPTALAIEQVVETLAHLHAYWWEHPWLGTQAFEVGYWSRDAEHFEAYLQRRTTSWQHLIGKEASWLPEDVRELYERVLTRLPYHWERHVAPRFHTGKNITLTHGDAYFANFLSPKDTRSTAAYLLDWQSPGFEIGAYDLVNLCATFWTSEQRQRDQREVQILRRYHAALQAHGVQSYTWDEMLTDYKIGLIFWLLMPVQDCYGGSKTSYWWPKMQCLVAAFREWNCEELLG